jgi:phospholipase/lecithinase/hemolysin
MSRISWRRAAAAVALGAATVLLAACGSSSTESKLNPARMISFGDAFSDVGQANGFKYTVNDTATNHWLQQVASRYGKTITASSSGGTGYARIGARIVGKPGVTGDATTLTTTEQIDAFLAAGGTFTADDLIFIDGGMSDALFESKAFLASTQTADQAIANARTAGKALAALAKRVVDAGAQHVVVVGAIQLGATPWGVAFPQAGTLTEISRNLNDAFLIDSVDLKLGATVLYLDAPFYFRSAVDDPRQFAVSNARDVVCTSVDPNVGIGIGSGEVNSALCTPSTIRSGATYDTYMFADKLYTTPTLQRQFGDYAYGRITNRW